MLGCFPNQIINFSKKTYHFLPETLEFAKTYDNPQALVTLHVH